MSGHHGPVNDMTFCGGPSTNDTARYVATVSGALSPSLSPPFPPLHHLPTQSPTVQKKKKNRRQNAHGLGPPPKRRHTLSTLFALALLRPEPRRVRSQHEHEQQRRRHQRAGPTDRLRDLLPARAELRLRARLDDKGPPRRRRARLARPRRLAFGPRARIRRRGVAPPARRRVRSSAQHRRRRVRVPGLRRLAAGQSRYVRQQSSPLHSFPLFPFFFISWLLLLLLFRLILARVVSAPYIAPASRSGTFPSYMAASRRSAEPRFPRARIVSGGVRPTPNTSPSQRAAPVRAARRLMCTAPCTPMPMSSRPRSRSPHVRCACATLTFCRSRGSHGSRPRWGMNLSCSISVWSEMKRNKDLFDLCQLDILLCVIYFDFC